MTRVVGAAVVAILTAASLTKSALANPPRQPFELAPFKDRVRPSSPTAACEIQVDAVEDERRATDTVGMLNNRAVKSPADTQAWLRQIVAGLGSRGFRLDFDGVADAPQWIGARFKLRTAWVNFVAMDKTITVVFRVDARTSDGRALDKDYRVNLVHLNWSGSGSELNGAFDKAFSEALDQIADDLDEACNNAK